MRPTIPLGDFRIAVDRTVSDVLRKADRGDAIGCVCAWCENWSVACLGSIPVTFRQQLLRVGVDPLTPSDLYAFESAPGGHLLRLRFFVSGQIVAGPTVVLTQKGPSSDDAVAVRQYSEVRSAPNWIGLAVASLPHSPSWVPDEIASVLELDIRLFVPWVLSSEQPPVFARV